MFWGSHRVRVDEKGRLAIPAQFRRQLPEGSFISIGQDGVLTIYPPEQWETLASRLLRHQSAFAPEARMTSAHFLVSAAMNAPKSLPKAVPGSEPSSRMRATM